ncbi:GNAT family N-acetyltransferase [Proteiniborus sp. MB09-C3]|uniref:GNAT family N-acetyltransferase n=1 Tax=Proteiniborus sp. MB09-C3 TaxID=3050072 RepID=UPI0025564D6D|nr:GNAT family N-acetyltransferase [Proteiniborus sp. MB09-C3]WIV13269.1 GNAT family N-acetyltransferase [Proteiniborus sp. MB09-C3]
MKVEALKSEKIEDFINYCKKHKMEIDDSFLYDEDLRDFEPNEENPTYIVTDNQDELKATASLIMNDYNKRGKKARFRIFHSEIEDIECYKMLMQAILKHTEGLDSIFVFVPLINKKLMNFIEELKFMADRYSFLLVREDLDVPEFNFPEDYTIRLLKPGRDEQIWCDVRNAGFAKLKGSEIPITPQIVSKMIAGEDNIEGGLMVLYHKERPIGIVRGSKDEYENSPIMNIGPLAIIPEYQGKGLGRMLLRASLNFAKEKSYKRTILCVNAENEKAKALYIQEGFKQVEAVVCYKYDI